MGHLVDAIKKLEQRRVIEEATPAPPAPPPAKSTRKRSRRIDPPHPTAAVPRAARRRASKPAGEFEPVADVAPPPAAVEAAEETLRVAKPVRAEATTGDIAPTVAAPPDAVPVEIAIEPIAQAAPAEASLAEQLPIDAARDGGAGIESLPVEKPTEVADLAAAAIPATIALAEIEAAPAVPVSAASPRATEPPRPLRLLVEDEVTAAAADVAPTIWEIPTPSVPSDYRELAARLCSPSLESGPVRSVLVVGATLAALEAVSLPALAVALSARGSVLWVDPRHRRPVTARTGADDIEAPGLRELAAGEAGWDEAIHKTSLADVSFVGCGVGPLDDRGEASLAAGLEPQPEGFSLILVDGGLAEEAAALAAVCQSVGLAVAIGHDRRGEIENALATLADAGVAAPLVIAIG